MAREFDIYLNRQVTECDLIIYNLPYREGLSVADRLIVESLIESYTLQKMIAVQTGSALVAHINEMLKTCNERLACGMELSQNAQFLLRSMAGTDGSALTVGVDDVAFLETQFASAGSGMILGAPTLFTTVTRPLGTVAGGIAIDASAETTKQNLISAICETRIGTSEVELWKHGFLATEGTVEITAGIADLCYNLYTAAENAIGMAQYVLGTAIAHPLGVASSAIDVSARVTGTNAEKFIEVENALELMMEATANAIAFLAPGTHVAVVGFEAECAASRHRMLSEMDEYSLVEFDDMTLGELDLINI